MTTPQHPEAPYSMAIRACLNALVQQLGEAQCLALQARDAMSFNNTNLAIGTILPLEQQLPECDALLRAVLTLNTARNRKRPSEGGDVEVQP
jgi:hypothetical protein